MVYSLSYNFHLGRFVFGLVLLYMGACIYTGGNDFYGPFLHATRRLVLGKDSKNKISPTLTWEMINQYAVKSLGVLTSMGGFCTMANYRKLGAFLIVITMAFMICTQDNPLLVEYIKPAPKAKSYRW